MRKRSLHRKPRSSERGETRRLGSLKEFEKGVGSRGERVERPHTIRNEKHFSGF